MDQVYENYQKILILLSIVPSVSFGEQEMRWSFDQERNVATVTTKQVIYENYPILSVVHYKDDHSWAFTCGSTSKTEDLLIVGMGDVVDTDPTLVSISDLPPGWSAYRESINDEWVRTREE